MKKFLFCCTCIFLFAAFMPDLFAQGLATPSSDQRSVRLHISGSTNRPRTIVPLWIDCYYYCGEMYFSSSEKLDDIEVLITNLETGYSYSLHIADSDSSIGIELSSGSYQILCWTEGNEYEGILNLS